MLRYLAYELRKEDLCYKMPPKTDSANNSVALPMLNMSADRLTSFYKNEEFMAQLLLSANRLHIFWPSDLLPPARWGSITVHDIFSYTEEAMSVLKGDIYYLLLILVVTCSLR